ncbi:hypothetical protein OIV83_003242 [Microbotryomycetes sp. JL201]|nr:hypothetical protein OIV83_003242 [Microbotryomycetes sp. JL201]
MSNPFAEANTSHNQHPGVRPGEQPPAYSASADGHLAAPTNDDTDYTTDEDLEHQQQRQRQQQGRLAEGGDGVNVNPDELYDAEAAAQPLPPGWRREFSSEHERFFYVDTNAKPPRSIWTHPYQDPVYLNSLSEKERKEILGDNPPPAVPDATGANSSHGNFSHLHQPSGSGTSSSKTQDKKDRSLGRKMKDKITGTTHEQRVAERKRRKEQEMKQYQQYIMARQQLLEAQRSGRYVPMYAPPAGPFSRPVYGYPGSMYGQYGYYGSPYGGYGYRRPGYGGPGMAAGGGLLGGLLVGSLLF